MDVSVKVWDWKTFLLPTAWGELLLNQYSVPEPDSPSGVGVPSVTDPLWKFQGLVPLVGAAAALGIWYYSKKPHVTKFDTDSVPVNFDDLKDKARNSPARKASITTNVKPKIQHKLGHITLDVTVTLDLLEKTVSIEPEKFAAIRCGVSIRNGKDGHMLWSYDDKKGNGRVTMPLDMVFQNIYRKDRICYLCFRLQIGTVDAAKTFLMSKYFGKEVGRLDDRSTFAAVLAESVRKYPDRSTKFTVGPFKKDDDTDLLLKCGKLQFWVHKEVVCGQSNVFDSMFGLEMVEKLTATAEIPNFETGVVKMFLEILYTRSKMNKVIVDARALVSLYRIAHQYGVPDIVTLTLLALTQATIEPELFYAVIGLAKVHDLQDLMKHCITCAKKYDSSFWEDPAYKELVTKDPNLAVRLMALSMQGAVA